METVSSVLIYIQIIFASPYYGFCIAINCSTVAKLLASSFNSVFMGEYTLVYRNFDGKFSNGWWKFIE